MSLSRVMKVDANVLPRFCIGRKRKLDVFKHSPVGDLGRVLDRAGISRVFVDASSKHSLESAGGILSIKIAEALKEGRNFADVIQSFLYGESLEATLRNTDGRLDLIIVGTDLNLHLIALDGCGIVSPPNIIRGKPFSSGIVLAKAWVEKFAGHDIISAAEKESKRAISVEEDVRLVVAAFKKVSDLYNSVQGDTENVAATASLFISELDTEVTKLMRSESLSAYKAAAKVMEPFVRLIKSRKMENLPEEDLNKAIDAPILIISILEKMLEIRYGAGGGGLHEIIKAGVPVVIVGKDFGPSDGAQISTEGSGVVVGVVIEEGNPISHFTLIAKGVDLPVVGMAKGAVEMIGTGDELLLDGSRGLVIVNPSQEQLFSYGDKIRLNISTKKMLEREKNKKPIPLDSEASIRVSINVETLPEVYKIHKVGAEGIGLLRTEIFLCTTPEGPKRDVEPSVEEQAEYYLNVLKISNGLPVTFRVVDIDREKRLPYLDPPKTLDEMPKGLSLGGQINFNFEISSRLIGTKLLLDEENHMPYFLLFRRQLKALLIAAAKAGEGQMRVMLPMVLHPDEVAKTRGILSELKAELKKAKLSYGDFPLGIMVENTFIVRQLETMLAKGWHGLKRGRPDFISIGTNDLSQWVLGLVRYDNNLSEKFDGMHRSVLDYIERTVRIAKVMKVPLSVCGDMASDPLAIPVLIGMGIEHLSMAAGSVLLGKHIIRGITLSDSARIAREAMMTTEPKEARKNVIARMKHLVMERSWTLDPNILDFITGTKL